MNSVRFNQHFNMLLILLTEFIHRIQGFSSMSRQGRLTSRRRARITPYEPSESEAKFGRQSYWEHIYQVQQKESLKSSNKAFAWYSTWDDIEPFWLDLVPDQQSKVLIAGVGNDPCLVSMYDTGWRNIHAFDYAPQGVQLVTELMGPERLVPKGKAQLQVADARDLKDKFHDGQFDAIFEKGTFDAIFLSGGPDSQRRLKNLAMAIQEMQRVLKPGGLILSITSIAIEPIFNVFANSPSWEIMRDSREVYLTDSGFASNNVDATMFAFHKR